MNVKFNIIYEMYNNYSIMILNASDTNSVYRQIADLSHIDEKYLRERFKADNVVDLLHSMENELIIINEMRVG